MCVSAQHLQQLLPLTLRLTFRSVSSLQADHKAIVSEGLHDLLLEHHCNAVHSE